MKGVVNSVSIINFIIIIIYQAGSVYQLYLVMKSCYTATTTTSHVDSRTCVVVVGMYFQKLIVIVQ